MAILKPSPALADEVGGGHAHAVEHRGAGRRAAHAHLVLEAADREAGPVGLDDERRDAARARRVRIGDGEDDVDVGDAGVRDPVLGAVDDPLVAVAAARVRIARGSDPASGSDRANAASHSPLARRGSTRALSSSEPARRIGSEPRSWTASSSDDEAQPLATSSIATHSMSAPVPVPPWASSNGSPKRSWSANRRRTSSGNSPLGVDRRRARRDALGDDLADDVAKRELLLGQPVQRDDGPARSSSSARQRDGAGGRVFVEAVPGLAAQARRRPPCGAAAAARRTPRARTPRTGTRRCRR